MTEKTDLNEFAAYAFVSQARLAAKLARMAYVDLIANDWDPEVRGKAATRNGTFTVAMIEHAAAVMRATNPQPEGIPNDNPVSVAVRALVDADEISRGIGLLASGIQDDLTAMNAYDAVCRGLKVDEL